MLDFVDIEGHTVNDRRLQVKGGWQQRFDPLSDGVLNWVTSAPRPGSPMRPLTLWRHQHLRRDTACYCRGTRILTEAARCRSRRWQSATGGDPVAKQSDHLDRPAQLSGRFVAGNSAVRPIRVEAGALAEGVPTRDLWYRRSTRFISTAFWCGEELINGASVVQAGEVEQFDYFHIELAAHDVIFAEGTRGELCRLRQPRHVQNCEEFARLHPDDTRPPGILRTAAGPRLDELTADSRRHPVANRANRFIDDPNVHLIIDGEIVSAHRSTTASTALRSGEQRRDMARLAQHNPAEVEAAFAGSGRLGVAVQRIVLAIRSTHRDRHGHTACARASMT